MTTHTPLRCANSGMVADAGKIVLLDSGNYPSFSSYLNQTWVWNGANGNGDWTNISPAFVNTNGPLGPSVGSPSVVMSGRVNQVMAFDGTNVMLYGGQGSSETAGVFQDTWTFNVGSLTWTLQSPATVPFGRYGAEAAYLTGTGAVMFGGETVGNLLLETWVWNGTTWSLVVVANGTGPAGRTGHCMAANSSEVVMFGGRGTNSRFGDTWTFNGTTWTQVAVANGAGPSARDGACMAYDSVNSLFVMFGGQGEYNFLPETWTFNGTTWTQVAVPNGAGPSGRISAQMAFDTTGGTTIMYGGIEAGSLYPSNATWSFNGATLAWTKL